jgi:hypothetical protein
MPHDVEREVFNLAFHLRQSVTEVMAWPSAMRPKFWKMRLDQYELDKPKKES